MKKILMVTGLVSQLFLFTSYVSAETLTVYGAPNDGTILSAHETSWSAAQGASVGNAIDTAGGGIDAFTDLFDSKYNVTRAFFVFDTSALPDNAEITNVTAHVHATLTHNDDNDANAYLGLYQGFQNPLTTLTLDDFELCGDLGTNPTRGASIDIDDISIGNYFTFDLNNDGKSWISRDGYTTLCVRDGHDAANDPISFVETYTYSGIRMKSADMPGTEFDPYLEITYTVHGEDDGVSRDEFLALVEEATKDEKDVTQKFFVAKANHLFDLIDAGKVRSASLHLKVFATLLRAKGIDDVELTGAMQELGKRI